jgi:hypothetical protein
MKRIQLVERNEKGQIHKNESYFYDQIEELVLTSDDEYWYNYWWGRIRRNALKKVLKRFEELTDQDKPGPYKLQSRL